MFHPRFVKPIRSALFVSVLAFGNTHSSVAEVRVAFVRMCRLIRQHQSWIVFSSEAEIKDYHFHILKQPVGTVIIRLREISQPVIRCVEIICRVQIFSQAKNLIRIL